MDIYNIIDQYFNSPIMTKLKDDNNESFYFSKIQTQLLNEYRYIIAVLPQDNYPIGKRTYLKNLNWHSFQTRTLKQNHELSSISYHSNILDNYHINVINRKENYTTYSSEDFPNIQIHVLITSNNMYEYPEHATLSNALEKYQTLINILN